MTGAESVRRLMPTLPPITGEVSLLRRFLVVHRLEVLLRVPVRRFGQVAEHLQTDAGIKVVCNAFLPRPTDDSCRHSARHPVLLHDVVGDLVCARDQFVLGVHLVDHAPFERCFGVDGLAGQQRKRRALRPEQLAETQIDASPGTQPASKCGSKMTA